ncbi:MAG: hypothetical protein JWL74_1963 [Alphaproteobacteria bacterium]|nr:hypothetical protein [Alphaproteobacteria bacterium]
MRLSGLLAIAPLLTVAACGDDPEVPAEPTRAAANIAAPAPDTAQAPSAESREPQSSSAGAEPPASAGARAGPATSACLMQGGERLRPTPLRALGTEPFWGARIEGRCVTYSTPDDQAGTRIWTRYTPAANGGTWVGTLGGERFELTTRVEPGCSDGMSDRRYPIAVELLVRGERRRGCAAPT